MTHTVKGNKVQVITVSKIGYCIKINGRYHIDYMRDRQVKMFSSRSAALQGARKYLLK